MPVLIIRNLYAFVQQKFTKQTVRLLIDGMIVGQAGIISGVFGYIFQIIMAHYLTEADFAIMAASFGLVAFIASPLTGVNLLVSRNASILINEKRIRKLKRFTCACLLIAALISILVYASGAFFIEHLSYLLKSQDYGNLHWILLLLSMAPVTAIAAALLQGYQLFRWSAALTVLTSTTRLAIGFLMVLVGLGIISAFVGTFVAQTLTFAITIMLLGMVWKRSPTRQSPKLRKGANKVSTGYIFAVFISGIALTGITQLDTFIANYIFDSGDASVYISSIIIAKVLLYIPNSMTYVLYPIVAQNMGEKLSGFENLNLSLLVSVCGLAICLTILFFFDKEILQITFGNNFRYEPGFLFLCALSVVPVSLIFMIEHFLVAKGIVFAAWLLIIVMPIEFLCVYIFSTSIWSIPIIMGAFNTVILVISYIFILSKIYKNKNEQRA